MVTLHRHRNWKIEVFGREHGIPHVHVSGPEFRATIAIIDGSIIAGALPPAILREVQGWLKFNRDTAMKLWRQRNPKHQDIL
jgi:Domain of unknown function (DUF4160)